MKLLLVEDEASYHHMLRQAIEDKFGGNWSIVSAFTGNQAKAAIETDLFQAYVLDIGLPWKKTDRRTDPVAGVELINTIRTVDSDPKIMVLSSQDKQFAVKLLLEHAVTDYVFKDTSWKEISARLSSLLKAARLEHENRLLRYGFTGRTALPEPLGKSPVFLETLDRARQVAIEDTTVLLQGESGTGKEVMARYIHRLSSRKNAPFIAMNCAAFNDNLIESELFGHARGAFTGADSARPGRFELADGGSLFLDEIGELPLSAQVKLLRVLQERKIERLGESRIRSVDVRIISATNRNLAEEVSLRNFRHDLFYRINVFSIELPALRNRKEDIPILATYFLKHLPRRRATPPSSFSKEAHEALLSHSWPGNIRELRNAVEHALIVEKSEVITPSSLPFVPGYSTSIHGIDFNDENYRTAMDAFERSYLLKALSANEGNVTATAKAIDIPLRTLRDRMKRYGLKASDFK